MIPDAGVFTTASSPSPGPDERARRRRRRAPATARRRDPDAVPRDPHDEGRYRPEWDERPSGGYYLCPVCRADAIAEADELIASIEARRALLAARRSAR